MTATRRLRIAFFGTGGQLSAAALRAMTSEHDVLCVISAVAAARGGAARRLAGRLARRLGLRASPPMSDEAQRSGVPEWPVTSVRDPRFARRLAALRLDLLCVEQFLWRLPEAVLGTATLGGVNLHPSLLPRHRGPLPLFWVYHADDRETGVTAHHLSTEFDRGDIIGQQSFPLARGYPVDELNAANARVGADVLREAVAALARGDATRRPQDERQATRAPFVRRGDRMVDFDRWDVERVWHFLAGVWPRFIEPLDDADGHAISYAGVLGYVPGQATALPGTASRLDSDRFALQCQDGIVVLRAATPGVAAVEEGAEEVRV